MGSIDSTIPTKIRIEKGADFKECWLYHTLRVYANAWADKQQLVRPRYDSWSEVAVIFAGNDPAGFLHYYMLEDAVLGDEVYISWIFVLPEYRNMHLASKLMNYIQLYSQQQNIHFVSSWVLKSNIASQVLHEKCKFVLKESIHIAPPKEIADRFIGYAWGDFCKTDDTKVEKVLQEIELCKQMCNEVQ